MLADARSLDALDFARIRERVTGQTHSARAAARAAALEPASDGTLVRQLVTETAEMRTLIRAHGFAPSGIGEVEAGL
jgi:dsDNA-specific endonuclease/ATPase MutS2